MTSPLNVSCYHTATPEERHRDPSYLWCGAQAGEPCKRARRYDGVLNPEWHAERIVTASEQVVGEAMSDEAFRAAVWGDGEV